MASSSKTHAGTRILLEIPSSPSSHPPAPTISLFWLTPLVMGSSVEWKCGARSVGFKAFTLARCVVGWFSWHIVLLSSVFYLLFLLMAVFFHAVCQDKSLAEGLGFLVIDFFFSFVSTFWPFLILNASCFVLPYSPHCHLSIHEGCLHCCVHLAHLLWPQFMTGKKSICLCWGEKNITIKVCVKIIWRMPRGGLRSAMTEMLSASRVLHSSLPAESFTPLGPVLDWKAASGLVHMDAGVYCTAKRLAVKGRFSSRAADWYEVQQ